MNVYLHFDSLCIHPTIARSMKYCQYTKSYLFSMAYKLVLLYVKMGFGEGQAPGAERIPSSNSVKKTVSGFFRAQTKTAPPDEQRAEYKHKVFPHARQAGHVSDDEF